MEKNTQFKIDSIEELEEAHSLYKDKWYRYSLESEIRDFNGIHDYKFISCDSDGDIYLTMKRLNYKTIPSPLKSSIKGYQLNENTKDSVDVSEINIHFDEVKPIKTVRCGDTLYLANENGSPSDIVINQGLRLDYQLDGKLELSDDEEKEAYDYVNPTHYRYQNKEVIDMMIDIWGKEAVSKHCEITAFKYRMRMGRKPEQPIERDLEKAKWYEQKAKELI